MKCPKDHVPMNTMTLLNTVIDVCPLCNGCWLDKDELTRITRSRKEALTVTLVKKKVTQFACPRCKGRLFEGMHPSIDEFYIDECEQCAGIWLDRGELPRLLSAKP
ncbi:MAG: zf-TFIIB domain-containing protein [Candidatus Eremiobacterota bacterium]